MNTKLMLSLSLLCSVICLAGGTWNDPNDVARAQDFTPSATNAGTTVSWSLNAAGQLWLDNAWAWNQQQGLIYNDYVGPLVDGAFGGVIYKFVSSTPTKMNLDIIANIYNGNWAGRKATIYYSDENDWANLATPLDGSQWDGGVTFETNPNWTLLQTKSNWGVLTDAGLADGNFTVGQGSVLTTDGTFYVRVDMTSVSAPGASILMTELKVDGIIPDPFPAYNDPVVQVLKGNSIEFTPPAESRVVEWDPGIDSWSSLESPATEFDTQAYTYNSTYATSANAITGLWVQEGTPGVGGIVWHFQAQNPSEIIAKGGMNLEISAIYEFIHVSAGNGFEIYYSDNNNWEDLVTDYNTIYSWDYVGMTGGVWDGPAGTPPTGWTGVEYDTDWVNVYRNRVWGGIGVYNVDAASVHPAGEQTIFTADGDFWVRVDMTFYQPDIFAAEPDQNSLGQVKMTGLNVKGILNYPVTCADVWELGYGMPSDLTHDCTVSIADFAVMANDWLGCNTPNDPDCTPTNW